VNGDRIRAERHARELVGDMLWRGMPVPALYTHMAAEFQDLVASGDYAAWVASGGNGPRSHDHRALRHLPAASPSARWVAAAVEARGEREAEWRRRGAGPFGGR
jgi:hypothetical protein